MDNPTGGAACPQDAFGHQVEPVAPHALRTGPLPPATAVFAGGRSVDDETRGTFQTMHANGMRLLKLINDLLDLVRLESGRLEVRLAPLASELPKTGIENTLQPGTFFVCARLSAAER